MSPLMEGPSSGGPWNRTPFLPFQPFNSRQALTSSFFPQGGRSGPRGGGGGDLSLQNPAPPHSTVFSGRLSASVSLQGSELPRGNSVSLKTTARCPAQASLEISSPGLLVPLDYTGAGPQTGGSPCGFSPACPPLQSPFHFPAGPPYQATRDMA